MADVAFIVDGLNAAPFNMKLMSHKFSDLKGLALLQKVHDVFLHIIPNAKPVDVQGEADPTSKLMEYLKAVKYKPPTDAGSFRLALASGARDVVYSLLKWLLSQVPVLQRRARIGIYLTMPEVPAEFRGIQEIASRIGEIQELQGDFKELHQQVEEAKASMPSVEELTKSIQRKENERASLRARTAKAKEKAQAHPSYDDLQASCKKLSAATQLVDNLKKDLVEEQQRRTAADRALERTSSRLADLKRALASGRGFDAVASLKQEGAKLRDLVNIGLPSEIQEKRKKVQDLTAAREVDSEAAVKRLKDSETRLRADVAAVSATNDSLRTRLIENNDADYRRLLALQDAAAKCSRKRDELLAKSTRLKAKLATLQKGSSSAPVAATPASSASLKEEWESKYAIVAGLLPAYKSCKAEEAAARAELETLQFTLETVREQRIAVEESIGAQERKIGAEGFAQASVLLDKVSEEKGKVDAEKGERMDAILEVVEQINDKIRSQKGILAPKITDLRAARAQHAEVTATHAEAKTAYMKAQDGHTARLAGLEEQVSELQAAVDEAESRYHTQAPMEVLYSALSNATSDSRSSVELLTGLKAAVEEEAVKQQDLCAQQAALKAQDDVEKLQGVAMMTGLQALMAAKLDLMQGQDSFGPMLMNTQYNTATANVLTLG